MYPQEQFASAPPHGAIVMQGGRVWYLDSGTRRLGACGACQRTSCGGCVHLGAGTRRLGACGACQRTSCGGCVHLGAGTAVGEAVGKGIVSSAALAGAAAPIVAAIGGLVELLTSFFGGGCGQACIQSATLEQVPEVALDDLHAVALQQPGAISGPMFDQAWQSIISYGMQTLQNLQAKGDKKAADGITNLQKSTDYTSFVATLPTTPTVALDLNAAQTVFTSPSATGWEPGSVSAGNSLALQVLQAIAASSPTSSSASSIVTSIESATGLSSPVLLAGAALLAYLFLGRS